MIDPAARREIMREQAFGADIAAVLLDVVLGYGSHPDPAGEIAGTCAGHRHRRGGRGLLRARRARRPAGTRPAAATLAEAGAIVTDSAAQAARTAAAVRGPGRRGDRDGGAAVTARAGPTAPVGLVTYSVKPRGGVVHTLALAEALHAVGVPVRVVALGDPAAGFYRPVAGASRLSRPRPACRRWKSASSPTWRRWRPGSARSRPSSPSCTPRTASRLAPPAGSGTAPPALPGGRQDRPSRRRLHQPLAH